MINQLILYFLLPLLQTLILIIKNKGLQISLGGVCLYKFNFNKHPPPPYIVGAKIQKGLRPLNPRGLRPLKPPGGSAPYNPQGAPPPNTP